MKKLIAGNWKMYLSPSETDDLLLSLEAVLQENPSEHDVMVFPSFFGLAEASSYMQFRVGAQDASVHSHGAHTGQIAMEDVRKLGCGSILLGHSEVRADQKISDAVVAEKFALALTHQLYPVLCVGESETDRQQGSYLDFVQAQLRAVFSTVQLKTEDAFAIAYEPIWAIGTGNACQPSDALNMIQCINDILDEYHIDKNSVKILYGGSVNENNFRDYLQHDAIEGLLIGGASAKKESFFKILA